MINLLTFGLLAFVILSAWLFSIKLRWSVPILVAVAYLAIQPIPMYVGYPIEERFVQGKEGLVLGGSMSSLMILFKGEEEPRLVRILDEDKLQQAIERSKKGATFIKFDVQGRGKGKTGEAGSGEGQETGQSQEGSQGTSRGGTQSSLRILKDEEQTMLVK